MFKTNNTEDRVSYSNILLPPDGYTLNFAVGTTYSLDLEALTSAALSLGLYEETDSELFKNRVSMLNALRKISEKVLIFCEAGQIKMPAKPSPLSLLLEKMIVPVALPKAAEYEHYPAFHSKTWIIQYVNEKGEYSYRFAVLSRNLTFDRSWDVSFAMDSSKTAQTSEKTQPIIEYLEFLRNQIKPTVQGARCKRSAIRKLGEDLDSVSFSTDSKEFGENFEIMPLGINTGGYDMKKDPLLCQEQRSADYRFHELVVFSPFVSDSLIEYWNKSEHSLTGTTRTLITRKSELSKIKAAHADKFRIYTLKDVIVYGEDTISDDNVNKQKQDIHAKIYLRKKYSEVDLYLGSMNATYSAVNKNVEMMIRLRTKKYSCETFLRELFCGDADNQYNPFELSAVTDPVSDPVEETANQLEQVIKSVCRLSMNANVTEVNGKYDVVLKIEKYDDVLKIKESIPEGNITIKPFRLNAFLAIDKSMLHFSKLDILEVSEFYTVRVALQDIAVERIIMIPTSGIPKERENAVVSSIIKDMPTFVEYVAFVLGDSYSSLLSLMEERSAADSKGQSKWHESLPAIYEMMLKTASEEPEKLGEIEYILQMINKDDIVPDEFRLLYATFKKTLKLK